eukprot:jgi/Psemu1/306140/fgenesh1_kg.237_\
MCAHYLTCAWIPKQIWVGTQILVDVSSPRLGTESARNTFLSHSKAFSLCLSCQLFSESETSTARTIDTNRSSSVQFSSVQFSSVQFSSVQPKPSQAPRPLCHTSD